MEKALTFYGFKNIEEAMEYYGFGKNDAERFIQEMYEEDTAPLA